MIHGHGGNIYDLAKKNGCRPDQIIDMSSNLNPLGPPPGLLQFLTDNMSVVKALPDADAAFLSESFQKAYGITRGRVLAGNGTTEFIYTIPKALNIKKALILGPTYSDYEDACRMNRTTCSFLMAEPSNRFHHDPDRIAEKAKKAEMVVICNPNNPTGTLTPFETLRKICKSHPDTLFVIDESYLPFISSGKSETMIHSNSKNIIVLSSMSKIFSIPGLRTGFLKAPVKITEKYRKYQLPWNVNSLAQKAATYILQHQKEMDTFMDTSRQFIKMERDRFLARLKGIPCFSFFAGQVPFILIKLSGELTAEAISGNLSKDNILIRNCKNFKGLTEKYIRISLKGKHANQQLSKKLSALVARK